MTLTMNYGWSLAEIECYSLFGYTNTYGLDYYNLMDERRRAQERADREHYARKRRNAMLPPELRDPPEHSGILLTGFP